MKERDQTEKEKATRMQKVSASGKELMLTTDPGRPCKWTSLDFYGQMIPRECTFCGLTLVSSPHLARSYHHLFPVAPFDEVPTLSSSNIPRRKLGKSCFGCQQSLLVAGSKPGSCVTFRKCKHFFCLDCDIYIHESLLNCPGCESIHRT